MFDCCWIAHLHDCLYANFIFTINIAFQQNFVQNSKQNEWMANVSDYSMVYGFLLLSGHVLYLGWSNLYTYFVSQRQTSKCEVTFHVVQELQHLELYRKKYAAIEKHFLHCSLIKFIVLKIDFTTCFTNTVGIFKYTLDTRKVNEDHLVTLYILW